MRNNRHLPEWKQYFIDELIYKEMLIKIMGNTDFAVNKWELFHSPI